jgi:hypothetical protein
MCTYMFVCDALLILGLPNVHVSGAVRCVIFELDFVPVTAKNLQSVVNLNQQKQMNTCISTPTWQNHNWFSN